jgi:hypothetical protein
VARQRLLLALAASGLLTAAVALPMAYQAQQARERDAQVSDTRKAEVLGITTIKAPEAVLDTLFWRGEPIGGDSLLHAATTPTQVLITLKDAEVVRVDFRLDDGPVQTDDASPFELDDGDVVSLAPGDHSLLATVTYADGRTSLHQAIFTTSG